MTGDHFEDDETRPVKAAPPVYKADKPDNKETIDGARERRAGGPTAKPKGPPAYDSFDDDATIMINQKADESGKPTHPQVAGRMSDLPINPATVRDTPAVGRDALAQRSEQTLGPPRNRPTTASSQSAWKPPARPNAPGVNSLEVRKQRSVVLFAVLAVVITLAIFLILLWLLGDG